jgi:hypothetical protein
MKPKIEDKDEIIMKIVNVLKFNTLQNHYTLRQSKLTRNKLWIQVTF